MRELTLMFVDSNSIGYGRLGQELARALTSLGVDIYDDMAAPDRIAGTWSKGERHKKTNVACWVSTPGHAKGWWDGQHSALFSMWEAQRLPESYREHLESFDTVIVPSQHNVELFGVYHPNVRYCPLGVDPSVWKYTRRREPTVTFNFLIGGSGARKGTDLAFKAFLAAFPDGSWGDGPIPTLIMKNPKGEDFSHPRVAVLSGRLSAEDEVAVYENAHCYLQPSRGEGFGLQPLQAMAQGIPTILTDAHGHKAFSYLGYGLSTTPSTSSYFIYGDAGDWWEPDFDELVERMRWVYGNYRTAERDARYAADAVAREFTWSKCAQAFVRAFDGALDVPYSGSGEWFTPEQKQYLTILNRDYTAHIAGGTFQFRKGEKYYEPADVKRILFEADLLDPACLEVGQKGETSGLLDTGLTPSQVERIGLYSAQHSTCLSCSQPLGSRPDAGDLALIEMRLTDFGVSADDARKLVYGS